MQCACAVLQSSLARPDMPYLSTLSHKRQDFRGKKNTKYTNTCVLSLKVLSKIFFILRTQLDTIMNVRRSSCKVQWDGQADTTKQTVALRNFATFFIQCSLISGGEKNIVFWKAPQVSPGCPSRKTNMQQGMWQWCDDDDRENPCPIPHWSPQISRGIELRPSRLEAGDGPPEPLHGLLKADNNLY